MHFAFPPRKTSHPPPYAARTTSRSPFLRLPQSMPLRLPRNKKVLAAIALGVIVFFYLLSGIFRGNSREYIPPGTPKVVIVTAIDPKMDPALTNRVQMNRMDYAKRHGYATFFPKTTDYKIGKHPESWAKIPALRHAMTAYPHSTFFWYLDYSTLIMNPVLSLESHVAEKSRLEKLMVVDVPVVPPDSVIKTFAGLKGDRIDFVLTQDRDGLNTYSFIIRRGDWARYFLDAWYDPIYRSYNFQRAETHALEHIVQWHGTMLAKLALVPQRMLIAPISEPGANPDALYHEGDIVASFLSCTKIDKRHCTEEMTPFLERAEKNYKLKS